MQLVLKRNIFKRIIDIVSRTENSDKKDQLVSRNQPLGDKCISESKISVLSVL